VVTYIYEGQSYFNGQPNRGSWLSRMIVNLMIESYNLVDDKDDDHGDDRDDDQHASTLERLVIMFSLSAARHAPWVRTSRDSALL
jgi:hypothetical protein